MPTFVNQLVTFHVDEVHKLVYSHPVLDTNGRARLAAILTDPAMGLSQAKIAMRLGVSQPAVSEWVAGHTRPTAQYRTAMAVLWGIPERDWLTTEEFGAIAVLELGGKICPEEDGR